MNVVRVEKTKDYSVISNVFLRDKELSYGAKGLLANIMTHSEQYEFSINGIVATSKEEKTAVYGIIKELIKNGYATKKQERAEVGFGKVIYTFYEKKRNSEKTGLLSGIVDAENVDAGIVDTGNQPQRSINNKEITNIRNTISPEASPPDIEIPDFDLIGFPTSPLLFSPLHVKTNSAVAGSKKDLEAGWKIGKFEDFWDRFKKKKSAAKVKTKWLTLTREEIEKILEVVDDHVLIFSVREFQFRPHPITWLNQRCWEDDISEELKKLKPRSYPKREGNKSENDW